MQKLKADSLGDPVNMAAGLGGTSRPSAAILGCRVEIRLDASFTQRLGTHVGSAYGI